MTPALLALLLASQAPQPAADAPELTSLAVLRAGDDACGLFNPAQRALLDAAIARASDDAVLSGADPARLEAALDRQTRVPACTDPQLDALYRDHLARIQNLASFTEIRFAGSAREWTVDRRPARNHAPPRWRVSQASAATDAIFGLAEVDGGLKVVLAFNGNTPFSSAVLLARDPDSQSHPVDFTAGGLLPPPGRDGASAWGASANQNMRFMAQDRLGEPVAASLAPASGEIARGFVFADQVLAQLAGLTPREGAAIELRDRSGEVAAVVWFEVGGLQAALAMQAIPFAELQPADPAPAP
jgi:hypothetical protein